MIVLGGCAAIELTDKRTGHAIQVPFAPGHSIATLVERTDVESFAFLEPTLDGFRNYMGGASVGRVDLIFGSNSELRSIAAYYACDDSRQVFVQDFVKACNKMMNADHRFDLKEVTQQSKLYAQCRLRITMQVW
jgi:catalase (peroxidase I)